MVAAVLYQDGGLERKGAAVTAKEVALVDALVHQLGEYFPVVAIMVSREDGINGTEMLSRGSGNYYARLGMCHEFINSSQAETLANRLTP